MAAQAAANVIAFPGVSVAEAVQRKVERLKGIILDDYEKLIVLGVPKGGGSPKFWTREITDAEAIAFVAVLQQSLIQKLLDSI